MHAFLSARAYFFTPRERPPRAASRVKQAGRKARRGGGRGDTLGRCGERGNGGGCRCKVAASAGEDGWERVRVVRTKTHWQIPLQTLRARGSEEEGGREGGREGAAICKRRNGEAPRRSPSASCSFPHARLSFPDVKEGRMRRRCAGPCPVERSEMRTGRESRWGRTTMSRVSAHSCMADLWKLNHKLVSALKQFYSHFYVHRCLYSKYAPTRPDIIFLASNAHRVSQCGSAAEPPCPITIVARFAAEPTNLGGGSYNPSSDGSVNEPQLPIFLRGAPAKTCAPISPKGRI
ncbi:hypothetical protein DFH09DRAFT_1086401 [Mycena vulgaris]|nr:hypothetical protein DFH09DRAFT_1086401 [Mycena vulgaris]